MHRQAENIMNDIRPSVNRCSGNLIVATAVSARILLAQAAPAQGVGDLPEPMNWTTAQD